MNLVTSTRYALAATALSLTALLAHAEPSTILPSDATPIAVDALTEPQILEFLHLAVDYDAESAALGLDSTHILRLQSYAYDLGRDGKTWQAEVAKIEASLGVKPQTSAESEKLAARFHAELATLRGAYGEPFDHEFIRQQVDEQYDLLRRFDEVLLPSATNQELHAALLQARSRTLRHLLYIKQIREDLNRHRG